MTDNGNRPIDILLKAQWDDNSGTRTLAKMDEFRSKLRDLQNATRALDEVAQAGLRRSDFIENLSDATTVVNNKFVELRQTVSGTVDLLEKAGSILGKLGARALLGGVAGGIAAAASFASDYGGVDPAANAQRDAQKNVKDAFDDLGRVTSRFVTPALQALANAFEGLATFLDRTFPSGQENPVSYFFNHTIPDAAKAMIDLSGIIRISGAYISKTVSEAFDTLATTFRTAGLVVESVFDGARTALSDLFANMDKSIQQAFDVLATTFRSAGLIIQSVFATALNAILELLATAAANNPLTSGLAAGFRGAKDLRASGGNRVDGLSDYEVSINKEFSDLLDRKDASDAAFAKSQANRPAGKDYGAAINKELSDLLARHDDFEAAFKKTVTQIAVDVENGKSAFDTFTTAFKAFTSNVFDTPRIARAEVEAFVSYKANRAKEIKAFYEEQDQIATQLEEAQLRNTATRTEALAELQKDQQTGEQQLADKYNADKTKQLEQFNANELKIQAAADLRREQNAHKHELTLSQLAAAGDVAGFVQEQQRYALDRQTQDQSAALESQQRQAAFMTAQVERDQQYAIDLDKLHAAGAEKQQAIEDQYAKQNAADIKAAADAVTRLNRKHDDELRAIDSAFAEQLASLDSNLGNLKSLRDADYIQQSADLQAFIATQGGYLQQLYQMRPGAANFPAASTAGMSPNTFNVPSIGGFIGMAQDAIIFAEGAIQNTVGDLVTGTAFGQAIQDVVGSISNGLAQAHNATQSRGRAVRGPQ